MAVFLFLQRLQAMEWRRLRRPRASRLNRGSPSGDRNDAAAHHLDAAELVHQRYEGVDLVGRAGHLEDEGLRRAVDDAGAEDIGDAQRLDALLAAVDHLDEGKVALDVSPLGG